MAKDLSDVIRDSLNQVVQDTAENIGLSSGRRSSNGHLGGMTGMALGAGLAAAAPFAARRATRAATRAARARLADSPAGDVIADPSRGLGDAASRLTETVGREVMDNLRGRVEEAGGVGGIARSAATSMIGGGGGGGGGGGQPGVGKGRRMPVQQSMDVAVPVETAYNQFTQYEDWPNFMHRVTNVSQGDDPTEVRISTKIWAFKREFTATIETQRPDERIRWSVSQGITHTGVVTFHELAPRLTRVQLSVDVAPGSLIEKAARGMRHVKRAMRADLHRYKAFIEMQEMETGAWRGVIEDGEVVEDHDPAYDEERDYSEPEAMEGSARDEEEQYDEGEDEEPEGEGEEEPEAEGGEEPEAEEDEEPEAEGEEEPEAEEDEEPEATGEDAEEPELAASDDDGDGDAPEPRASGRRRAAGRPRPRAASSTSSRGRAAGSGRSASRSRR